MVKDSDEEEGEPQEDANDKDWEPGEDDVDSEEDDYGGYGQLFQGIDDTIYAYRGDDEDNGFDSDYDPLDKALYEPGGLYRTRRTRPSRARASTSPT